MNRPSFASTIAALRKTDPRYPWVGPTEHEADAADALEVIQDHHQPTSATPDDNGAWGVCTACDPQPWPCPVWAEHEQLAVQWLGRAADRVVAHAQGREMPDREPLPVRALQPADPTSGLEGHDDGDDSEVGPSELMRRRYPPTGIPELWVKFGPDGPPPGYGDGSTEAAWRTA